MCCVVEKRPSRSPAQVREVNAQEGLQELAGAHSHFHVWSDVTAVAHRARGAMGIHAQLSKFVIGALL